MADRRTGRRDGGSSGEVIEKYGKHGRERRTTEETDSGIQNLNTPEVGPSHPVQI